MKKVGTILRRDMPQVKSTLVPTFLRELEAEGHSVWSQMEPADPSCLRPSQGEMVEETIISLMGKQEQLAKPVLVSLDGFVLDGHHRWAANHRLGQAQDIIILGLNAEEALAKMHSFCARNEGCEAKN